MNDRLRQILNISAVVGTLTVNALSQAIPFNGQTSAEIANRFLNNYFLPANYVFGVWGVIYLGLIAFGIYRALPRQRENPRIRAISGWFVLAAFANCTWLFLFHYNQFALSTVAMLILLISLAVMYLRLRVGAPAISALERWCVRIPLSIYFGWITVATIANFTYVLLDVQWDAFGIAYEAWGAIMLVIGGVIAGIVAVRYRDIAYAAVIVWAFIGIVARHPNVSEVVLPAVIMAGLVGAGALASAIFGLGHQDAAGMRRTA